MAQKNGIYNIDNGNGFDEIHFKTNGRQVFLNNGKTVEEYATRLNDGTIDSKNIEYLKELNSGFYKISNCTGFPYGWGHCIITKFAKTSFAVIFISLEKSHKTGIYYNTCQDGIFRGWYMASETSAVNELEIKLNSLEENTVNIIATNWDMDFRLCEVEWCLEDMVGTINYDIKGVNTMALSRYEQAKIMILGGVYNKETLTRQLTTYLNRDYITQEEYNELISLMEARELVTDK